MHIILFFPLGEGGGCSDFNVTFGPNRLPYYNFKVAESDDCFKVTDDIIYLLMIFCIF